MCGLKECRSLKMLVYLLYDHLAACDTHTNTHTQAINWRSGKVKVRCHGNCPMVRHGERRSGLDWSALIPCIVGTQWKLVPADNVYVHCICMHV